METMVTEREGCKVAYMFKSEILDNEHDDIYDNITELALKLCDTSVALISFVDLDREWIKSARGVAITEIPLMSSIAAYTIHSDGVLQILDLASEKRFADNPLCTNEPFCRFYAGVPIITTEGTAVGTISVLDRVPRELTKKQIDGLIRLSKQITELLQSRKNLLNHCETIIEREKIRQALHTNEERYKHLIDHATDSIYRMDASTKIIFMNQAGISLLGYREDEIIGSMAMTFVHPSYQDAVRNFYLKQINENIANTYFEFLLTTKSGEECWIGQHVQIITVEGNELQFQAIARNITEKKKLEEMLEREKQMLRAVMENIPDQIYAKDSNSKFLLCNKAVAANAGVASEEEVIGKSDFDFFPKQYAEEYFSEEQAIMLAGESLIDHEEQIVNKKTGELRWNLSTKIPLKDTSGKIVGLVGVNRDITERKLSEDELEVQKAYFEGLFENAPEAIVVLDEEDRISKANSMFTTMFGYTREEATGKLINSLIVPQHLQEESISLTVKAAAGEFVSTETIRIKKDGTPIHVSIMGTPIHFAGGRIGVYGIYHDITARKKVEDELIKAKEQAEESRKAKGEFLAKMSHEIRTPMNGILGMSHLLMQTTLDAEQKEYLETIKLSADNLLVIINDILDFSKIEANKMKFENIPFNVNDVVRTIYQTMKHKAEEKNISLEITIDKKLPKIIIGDPVRLNQILLNLVSNAIKFTHNGNVQVGVSSVEEKNGKVQVAFSVKDTGIGIEAEKISDIFASFTQASLSTTRKYGGTGLGLSIAKQLVELQGGTMTVTSTLDEGSTFVFTISYAIGERAEVIQEAKENPSSNRYVGLRVLLAEDNSINQFLVKKIVTQWGFSLDIADNGRMALDMLKKVNYDIVLMDIQMPELDGYETTLYIRNKMEAPVSTIPIIAMTASALQDELNACHQVGVNDYITKPFNPEELYTKIVTLMDIRTKQLHETKDSKSPVDSTLKNPDVTFDLNYLRTVAMGDEHFILEMLTMISTRIPVVCKEMEQFISTYSWQQLHEVTHKVKPSLHLLGIEELTALINKLDSCAAKERDVEQIPVLFKTFKHICNSVMDKLEYEIQSLQALMAA